MAALEHILRVFPRRTSFTPNDSLAYVGEPPLIRPEANEVHISVAFTWDVAEGERLLQAWRQYYPLVRLGGPAFGDPGDQFTPGRYLKAGHVITSRGCIRHCPWCLVPKRTPSLRLLPVCEGWIIDDDNFLATPQHHQEAVFAMLSRQRRAADFRGGIDARLVTPWFAGQLRHLRVSRLFLACDSSGAVRPLARAMEHLAWLGRNKLYCYVLVGFNGETLQQAENRLEQVWELGLLPFAQLFRPPGEATKREWPFEWRQLARRWSRPALTKALHRHAGTEQSKV